MKKKEPVICKVCKEPVEDVVLHASTAHNMSGDEYTRYDPAPFPGGPRETFIRQIRASEPSPPETMVEMRLVDCESNPFSCSVEARRGCVYHFQKPTRGQPQWQKIPAPDVHILLGDETSPPKYSYLIFEAKRR